jgi:DNA-binding transcriptional LysR family regulator
MTRMDLARLDLNLLVVLDRLLDRQSVGQAAADLHRSQPAVSRSLQRLRDALGDPLLVRVGRGMVPTERARGLAGPVAEALAAARRVFAPPDDFDPAAADGALVVAAGDDVQHAFADALATALWSRCPGVDLRLSALSAATVEAGRRGDIDLALSPDLSALPRIAGRVDTSEFVHQRLYERRFVVAEAASAGHHDLTLERWLAASHAIVSFETGGRGFVDELLAERGLSRRVAASLTSFIGVAHLVERSGLLAVMPAEVVRAMGPGLRAWPVPIPVPTLPMSLIWHPRQTRDPRHRYLRELVAEAIRARA